MLTLARPFNLRRQIADPERLITDVFELIEPDAMKAGITIEVALSHRTLIDGDRDLLRQVMLNICLNGMQAVGKNGRLRIELLNGEIIRNEGHFIALRISDTGPGISSENLAHIFDPFFTTKDVGKGVGLGLAVSHRIVEEHGGWIEVENEQKGGAAFTIYLPKASGELPHEQIEEGRIQDARASVDR